MATGTQGPRPELGARLRHIRLEHGLTLQQLAEKLAFFGSKGTFSEYENGRRVAPVALLHAYAAQFGVDAGTLLRLRADALTQSAHDEDDTPAPLPAAPPEGLHHAKGEPAPRSRRGRLLVGSGGVLLVSLSMIGWGMHARAAAPLRGSITSPAVTAPATEAVRGKVTGLRAGQQLWLAIQVDGEHRWHPTETPCAVIAHAWSFPTLYLGRPEDRGKRFRILLIVTAQGSAAQQALIDYAQRPTNTPDAYLGMPALPAQAQVLAETDVVRS